MLSLPQHLLQGQSTYFRAVAPMLLLLLLPVAENSLRATPGLAAIVALFAACVKCAFTCLRFAIYFNCTFASREH